MDVDVNGKLDIIEGILSSSNELIICLSTDQKILEINSKAEQIFGVSKKDLLLKNFIQICQQNNFDCSMLSNWQRIISGEPIKDHETSMKNNFIVKWKVFQKNKIIFMVGTDITDYKILSEKAKYAKFFLEKIIDNLPHFIFWKDTNSKFLGCNKKFSKSVRLNSPDEIVDKTDFDMPWSAEQSLEYIKDDKIIINSGLAKLDYEETQRQLDGTEKIMLVSKVPVYDGNKILGILGVYTDITKRKQMEANLIEAKEQAEQSNKAKSEFLAIVSHELRTPLNGIMGAAQLLEQSNLSDEQKKLVEITYSSGENLVALIDDILNFSKISEGQLTIEERSFDLSALLDEIIQNMRFQAELKKLKFIIEDNSNNKLQVLSDSLRLQEILMNILSNAIKYTEKGFVKLKINYEKISTTNINLHVSIEDSGIGIPSDKLNIIFERFQQIESSYARKFGGVGLGLAITKQLIERMGGTINVESELGKGSRFWFSIPLKIAKVSIKEKQQSNHKKKEVIPNINSELLIVEDNPINQTIAKMMLNELKYSVDIAEDGLTALKKFSEKNYHLIFMDISLPIMDGITVIKKIRELSRGKKIPIVAMTAHAMEEDQRRFLQAGANDVITKPLIKDDLQKIIEKWTQ